MKLLKVFVWHLVNVVVDVTRIALLPEHRRLEGLVAHVPSLFLVPIIHVFILRILDYSWFSLAAGLHTRHYGFGV